MTIIERERNKFYVPETAIVFDEVNKNWILDDTQKIDYDLYLLQEELKIKQEQFEGINISDEALLEWAKSNNPDIENKNVLEQECTDLQNKINNWV